MELRVLKYFLAIAREQSISKAAETLHLSQPTLSRQIKEMEDELGKQLFIRGNRKIILTEEGMMLRRRAQEIIELVEKTEDEISQSDDIIAGDISIGTGETDGVRFIAQAAQKIRKDYPLVHLNISSGDAQNVIEELEKGLIDFGLIFGEVDDMRYDSLRIPFQDTWGVLMRKDSSLAGKEVITAEDLWDKPLIISRQALKSNELAAWLKQDIEKINIVATYSLLFNGSLMVDEGMGYAICFDKIINVSGDTNLCFKPLYPTNQIPMNIIWKKYQIFTKAAEKLLEKMRGMV